MDKEDDRRLRCLQALLLGGFIDAGFRQSLLEVIARKGGVFSLDQVNQELVESSRGRGRLPSSKVHRSIPISSCRDVIWPR